MLTFANDYRAQVIVQFLALVSDEQRWYNHCDANKFKENGEIWTVVFYLYDSIDVKIISISN